MATHSINLNHAKSDQDPKLYAYHVLSNQLRVLLISDPRPNAHQRKAAASLSIGVGSSSDPSQVQGIAHFLEHMMSMGCKDYPGENDYAAYLDANGGTDNAWTDFETTLYHQEVEQNSLEESLKRMAAVFTAPLLRKSSFQREMNAVDSEFKQSLESDADRLSELWHYTSQDGHPFKRFTWGNLQSLRDDPTKHNVDVQQELQQFHSSYYSSNLMALCVVSAASLSSMETMVRNHFTSVPNRGVQRPCHKLAGSPWFRGAGLEQIHRMVPVKDHLHQLHMTFPSPPTCIDGTESAVNYILPSAQVTDGYRKRVDEMIGHIIGYEGTGSLLSWLKQNQLAYGLSAGCGSEPGGIEKSSCCSLFSIEIALTERGVRAWKTIVLAVMHCIGLIRDTAQDDESARLHALFQELQAIGSACLRFQPDRDPCDLSEEFAELMQHRGVVEHPEDLLYAGHSALSEQCTWDPVQFQSYICNYFVPTNCRIDLVSSSFSDDGGKKDRKPQEGGKGGKGGAHTAPVAVEWLVEPRFGTRYTVLDFDKELLIDMNRAMRGEWRPIATREGWSETIQEQKQNAGKKEHEGNSQNNALNPFIDITLPHMNPFVAHDFDLKHSNGNEHGLHNKASTATNTTIKVTDTSALSVWFKPDVQFCLPHLDARFEIDIPLLRASPLSLVLTDVFVRLIQAEINEFCYDADCAGLYVHVSNSQGGLFFSFSGFNHKMPELVGKVGNRVSSIIHLQEYSKEHLANILETLKTQYTNQFIDPSNAARFWRLSVLQMDAIHRFEFNPATDGVHLLDKTVGEASLNRFLSKLLVNDQAVVRSVVHGNGSVEEAQEMGNQFVHGSGLLPVSATPSSARHGHYRTCQLPNDRSIRLNLPTSNPNETNSVIEMYFQGSGRSSSLPWFHELSIARIIADLLEEPVFDCLRTKEQLGYTVHCDHRSTYGVVGFYFNIISASHTTAHLEDRIEHFCNCALSYLKNMSIEEYKKRLKTYSIALSEPHTDLEESADEMWQGVTDRHECFDGIDKRVASSVLSIGKEELVQWWSTYVVAKENRRKLVVCVNAGKVTKHGCSPDNEEKEEHESDSASSDGGEEEEEEEEEESDEEEEDEEEDFLEFPTTGELSTDWWKIAYPVVELETTDVALFKATLELLPAPVEKQSRTSS